MFDHNGNPIESKRFYRCPAGLQDQLIQCPLAPYLDPYSFKGLPFYFIHNQPLGWMAFGKHVPCLDDSSDERLPIIPLEGPVSLGGITVRRIYYYDSIKECVMVAGIKENGSIIAYRLESPEKGHEAPSSSGKSFGKNGFWFVFEELASISNQSEVYNKFKPHHPLSHGDIKYGEYTQTYVDKHTVIPSPSMGSPDIKEPAFLLQGPTLLIESAPLRIKQF